MINTMRGYAKMIATELGTDDAAMAGLVEELMRSEHGCLDNLTPARFRAAVWTAAADVQDLHAAGILAGYCQALGIAAPVKL